MTSTEQRDREDLAAAFRWTARLGLHEAVSNHFSLALDDQGSRFLVQPAGQHFSRVRASDLLVVDANNEVVGGQGVVDPTALGLHGAIHRSVPNARCVLHTHMPYATALTCVENGRVEPISQNALKFYERIAYDNEFGGMAMDDDETDRICALLQDKPVLLMGNHGVTVVGNTVSEAFDRLYFLEKTCESQVLAMSTGLPLKYVDEATARRTRDQWENYPGLEDNHWSEIHAMLQAEHSNYRD